MISFTVALNKSTHGTILILQSLMPHIYIRQKIAYKNSAIGKLLGEGLDKDSFTVYLPNLHTTAIKHDQTVASPLRLVSALYKEPIIIKSFLNVKGGNCQFKKLIL